MSFRDGVRLPAGVGLGLRYAFLDELAELVADGTSVPLDFLEVCPENYMRRGGAVPRSLFALAERFPVLAHGLTMSFGNDGPLGGGDDYVDELKAFLARLAPSFHSDHLCFSATQGRFTHDLLPLPFIEESVLRVAASVREARERLGRPIAVENISYYFAPGYSNLSEAEFLSAVLQTADCGLLLDVNNVYVNARNFGTDPFAFIDALPLERVVQLHVAGHDFSPSAGCIVDTHGASVTSEVLQLLEHTLRRTGPVPVVLERDSRIPPLAELLREVALLQELYLRATQTSSAAVTKGQLPENVVAAGRVPEVVERLPPIVKSLMRSVECPSPVIEACLVAELAEEDRKALLSLPPSRFFLYRTLVRQGLLDAARTQMPEAAAVRGEAFSEDLHKFVECGLPRSAFLRDVPRMFIDFIAPFWQRDAAVPAFLCDLARYELVGFEVAAKPDATSAEAYQDLEVERPVALLPAVSVERYQHAVQEVKSPAVPLPRPTQLLCYRDSADELRWLSLSEVAANLVERLLDGQALGSAIQQAFVDAGAALTTEGLSETSAFLADLAKRGVLLGRALTVEPDRMKRA